MPAANLCVTARGTICTATQQPGSKPPYRATGRLRKLCARSSASNLVSKISHREQATRGGRGGSNASWLPDQWWAQRMAKLEGAIAIAGLPPHRGLIVNLCFFSVGAADAPAP
jgi:hypothetical protein